ncbi:MAG: hypothetical protein V5A68_03880 [Candidatus Thermoplasmatota archaeon]
MDQFNFEPSKYVPFRDTKVLDQIRNISKDKIENHENPDFNIQVVPDDSIEIILCTDMFQRIKQSDEQDEKVVMIVPNPNPVYEKVAFLLNKYEIDCRNLYIFMMDEWANQDGNVAPESYPQSFMNSFKQLFYQKLNPKLRPPEKQIIGPTTDNINEYSNLISDMGGADICYSGPGWTGHLAFIEPDAPEFKSSIGEFKKMGSRIVTLSPFTIAQNSLHGIFGASGDIANVPPKAATIGPKDVLCAKHRIDFHSFTTAGSFVSWQRMISRLALHGPVTPEIPASILQTVKTDVFVSESIAANIKPKWDFHY